MSTTIDRRSNADHLSTTGRSSTVPPSVEGRVVRQDPNPLRGGVAGPPSGAANRGQVTFRELGVDRTEVTLDLDFEPGDVIDGRRPAGHRQGAGVE